MAAALYLWFTGSSRPGRLTTREILPSIVRRELAAPWVLPRPDFQFPSSLVLSSRETVQIFQSLGTGSAERPRPKTGTVAGNPAATLRSSRSVFCSEMPHSAAAFTAFSAEPPTIALTEVCCGQRSIWVRFPRDYQLDRMLKLQTRGQSRPALANLTRADEPQGWVLGKQLNIANICVPASRL